MSKYHKKLLYKLYLFVMIVTAIFAPLRGYFDRSETFVIYAENKQEEAEVLGEEPDSRAESTIPASPSPKPVFDTEIEEYIYEVFGKDYDKAMLLLKGDGVCGGENRGLDSSAVYENKKADGTVWSKDRGIFQINSVFHPLTDEQAFNYKTNIDYSKRMFDNDGGTFSKRWAAGKCLAARGHDI